MATLIKTGLLGELNSILRAELGGSVLEGLTAEEIAAIEVAPEFAIPELVGELVAGGIISSMTAARAEQIGNAYATGNQLTGDDVDLIRSGRNKINAKVRPDFGFGDEPDGGGFEDIVVQRPIRRPRAPALGPEEEEKVPLLSETRGRKKVKIDEPEPDDPESGDIEVGFEEPIIEEKGPPLSAIIPSAGLLGAGGVAIISGIKEILRDRGFDDIAIKDIVDKLKGDKLKGDKKRKRVGFGDIRQDKIDTIVSNILKPQLGRQIAKTTIKAPDIYELPDDSVSYSYVDLVRIANANYEFSNNIFNTKF